MRRIKQEISDKGIIEEILEKSEICRLGFMDQDRAYVLPFNYGYQDNHIYIHCAKEGKKIDLIKKNNTVGIEIEQTSRIQRNQKACKWTTIYRSVVGYGEVEIITNDDGKRQGLDIIMKHNGADENTDLNYDQQHLDSVSILKIRITEITGKQSSNWIDDKTRL